MVMDGDFHFALSRFVLQHHREAVVVLDAGGHVVDKSQSAENAELDIAALFEARERDLRIDAFVEELGLSGQAHTLVASPNGAVFRLEGTAVDKFRIVVAHQLSKADEPKPSLGIVAASFVHDLNNLLMPILLLSGRLARELRNEEESESAMIADEIHSSASLATALARDVLALARPRAESIERVDVNEMVCELERLARRLAGPQVDVLFALGTENELETRVDRKRLEHTVLSLVVAARDAMPDGGHLAIATALVDHAGARRIALSLTDTGNGDGADAQARRASIDGFICDVSSARGRGTSVTLLLEPAPPPTSRPEPREVPEVLDASDNVIMVAERDDLVRRAIQRVLESHGWTVVSVASKDDALEAAAVHPLRVAMLDSAIFRRDPTTFLHQLRALAPKMRLVLLADQTACEHVPQQVVVLPKPFGDEELVRAVRQALG
jgi:two-component system, cell cycle sensor histidine kinase and response regulator CckA